MPKKVLLAGLAVLTAVMLSACANPWQKAVDKSAEKAAEKAIEDASGGQADVDIDSDSGAVSVNTGEGSLQVGEDVKLPDGFPGDIYVLEGKLAAAIRTNENDGYSLTIETDQPVSEIKDTYQAKLEAEGWTISATMDYGTTASIVAEKEARTATVVIGSGEQGNTVILTVGKNQQ